MHPVFFKLNAKNKNTIKSTNMWYRNYCNRVRVEIQLIFMHWETTIKSFVRKTILLKLRDMMGKIGCNNRKKKT